MKKDLQQEWRNGVLHGNYGKNLPEWLRELHIAILDKYGAFINDFTWESGSSTTIYPLELWRNEFSVLLNTKDKRHFSQKGLDGIVERFPQVKRAYYSDYNSTHGAEIPDTLVFEFKEPLWK